MISNRLQRQALAYLVLLVAASVFVIPYGWLFVSSFKPTGEIMTRLWPTHWTFANFTFLTDQAAATGYPFMRNLLNSVFISSTVAVSVAVFGSMCAYGLTQFDFPGRGLIHRFVILQIVFPALMFVVPMYTLVRHLHLLNTYGAVIIPALMTPWSVFLFAQVFRNIPKELLDAARMDGASEWSIIWKIVFPLTRSIFGVVALFTFTASWDDLLWPLIVIQAHQLLPLTPSVTMFALSEYTSSNYLGAQLASAVLLTTPILVLYLIFRRWFTEGVALSSGLRM